jgi:6-phosphogluconate dehydrogenase
MKIGMVGLGKMGANMTQRLIEKGHEVVAFDLSEDARAAVAAKGAATAATLKDMVAKLDAPRVAWVMVPAGAPTNSTIDTLKGLMERGDAVIDGGNSNYKEAGPTAASLAEKGIGFVDAGTSGGVWGLANGYCLMVGGDKAVVALCEPAFRALAPEGGYAHVGPVGAGHFVKMVHNGIEYGLMQAYGEGFEIMQKADEFSLDLHEIASIWRYGSVVRSWLLELAERALAPGSGFDRIEGVIADSGEGRWTVQEAIDRGVPAPVITASLYQRFASRDQDSYANRLIAALRNQFGGHAVVTEPDTSAPRGRPGAAAGNRSGKKSAS